VRRGVAYSSEPLPLVEPCPTLMLIFGRSDVDIVGRARRGALRVTEVERAVTFKSLWR